MSAPRAGIRRFPECSRASRGTAPISRKTRSWKRPSRFCCSDMTPAPRRSAWAFVHIWGRREVVERIREENDPAYLEACLKESLRLCPVVVHMTRVASQATRVSAGTFRPERGSFRARTLAERDPAIFPGSRSLPA